MMKQDLLIVVPHTPMVPRPAILYLLLWQLVEIMQVVFLMD